MERADERDRAPPNEVIMVRNKLIEVSPFVFIYLFTYIYLPIQGEVAEWLGRGLQNLLQRFESALRLNLKSL